LHSRSAPSQTANAAINFEQEPPDFEEVREAISGMLVLLIEPGKS
jgi:hypothetical protein